MLSTRFKTGIVGGNEVYVFQKAGHKRLSTQTIPFPNSLITFLYMDMAMATPLLQKATDALSVLIQTHDTEYARKMLSALSSLAKLHIYFEFLLQDWQDRISTAQELNSYTEQLLNPSLLRHIPENMRFIQKQIGCLFARVLDKDSENAPSPPEWRHIAAKAEHLSSSSSHLLYGLSFWVTRGSQTYCIPGPFMILSTISFGNALIEESNCASVKTVVIIFR